MNEKFKNFLEQQKAGNLAYINWLLKNEILVIKDILIIVEEYELWIEEQQKLKLSEENLETTLLSE